MPRYFFDVQDNGEAYHDLDGVECADIGVAKKEAVTALIAMIQDELPDGDHHLMAINVRDAAGAIQLHLALHFDVVSGSTQFESGWEKNHAVNSRSG